jgi:hypothetical protein
LPFGFLVADKRLSDLGIGRSYQRGDFAATKTARGPSDTFRQESKSRFFSFGSQVLIVNSQDKNYQPGPETGGSAISIRQSQIVNTPEVQQ